MAANKAVPGCFVAVFSLAFGAAGLFMLWALLIKPVAGLIAAAHWVETPCTIVSSSVGEHEDSDGSTYSIDVTYSYSFGGRDYTGSRFNFGEGSSSGYRGKAAVVQRFPEGSRRTCFVDANSPSQSVINRRPGWYLLLGLVPFVFIGVAVALPRLVRIQSGASVAQSGLPGKLQEWKRGGELVLKPQNSRIGALIGVVLLAAFWNGIVSVFLFGELVPSYREGHPDLFLSLFLIPFVLIGLGLIAGIVYTFLALFNPLPVLRLSTGVLHPGCRCNLSWEVHGDTYRLRSLAISLEGTEEATYRQGTSSKTDTVTVVNQVLYQSQSAAQFERGSVQITFPARMMPSFEAPHNRVKWTLCVKGDVPHWPDVNAKFPLVVRPYPEVA